MSLLTALGSVVASSSTQPTSVFFLLNILLVATVPVVIARSLWRRQVIDVHTVLGAVCIYVLLGMMFAFVYAAIDGIGDEAFFVQTTQATTPDFLYFSFITQTTVGYGDFTAAHDLGRALAVVEALTGQLYLVTIIAVLVSRLSRARRARILSTRRRWTRIAPPRRDSLVGFGGRLQEIALVEEVEQPERRQDHDRGDDEDDRHRPQRRIGRRGGGELHARRQDVRVLGDAPSDDHGRHRAHGEDAGTGVLLAHRSTSEPSPQMRRQDHQRERA